MCNRNRIYTNKCFEVKQLGMWSMIYMCKINKLLVLDYSKIPTDRWDNYVSHTVFNLKSFYRIIIKEPYKYHHITK